MENKKNYKCVFKEIYRTTVRELKALDDKELQKTLETLHSEMREVHRAVNWIEGIIKLKNMQKGNSNE